MTADELQCWKCGAPLAETPLPLSRYAQCRQCGGDLYVCRMCSHCDARWKNACREERAEAPMNRDHANFCDWFSPKPGVAHGSASAASAGAAAFQPTGDKPDPRAALDALFGGATPPSSSPEEARNALDALFKSDPGKKD